MLFKDSAACQVVKRTGETNTNLDIYKFTSQYLTYLDLVQKIVLFKFYITVQDMRYDLHHSHTRL